MQMLEPRLDFGSIARNPTESVRPDLWPDHAWVPSLGRQGARLVDVADGRSGGTLQNGATWSSFGVVLDGVNDCVKCNPPINLDARPMSFFTSCDIDITASNEFGNIFRRAGSSDGTTSGMRLHLLRLTSLRFSVVTYSAWALMDTTATLVGGKNTFACTYDGSGRGTQIQIYNNGQVMSVDNTIDANATIVPSDGYPIFLGARTDQAASPQQTKQTIYVSYLFSSILTPSQIRDLSADPLLPLRRAPQVSYFIAAGLAIPILINQARRRRT